MLRCFLFVFILLGAAASACSAAPATQETQTPIPLTHTNTPHLTSSPIPSSTPPPTLQPTATLLPTTAHAQDMPFPEKITFYVNNEGGPDGGSPCWYSLEPYLASGNPQLPAAEFVWGWQAGDVCIYGLGVEEHETVSVTVESPYGTYTDDLLVRQVMKSNDVDVFPVSLWIPAGTGAGVWHIQAKTSATTFESSFEVKPDDQQFLSVAAKYPANPFYGDPCPTTGTEIHFFGQGYLPNQLTGFGIYSVENMDLPGEGTPDTGYSSEGRLVDRQSFTSDNQGRFHTTLTIPPEFAPGYYAVVMDTQLMAKPGPYELVAETPTEKWAWILEQPLFTVCE